MRPTSRAKLLPFRLVPVLLGRFAAYPVKVRYRPSCDSVITPLGVAEQAFTIGWGVGGGEVTGGFPWVSPALVLKGISIDCTKTPAGVYSSRKIGLPPLVSATDPSPTR